MTPTGVVLAGGASRRMGTDKALVAVDGVAMASRVATALAAGGCHPVICQGGDVDGLVAIGLAVFADSRPGAGPLPAILDALARESGDLVVCACDLAWLDGATVTRLRAVAAEQPGADVIVAGDADGPHLAALWRAGAGSPLADLVAGGVRSYRAALDRLATVVVDVPPAVVANVNKPEDLRRHR